MIINNKKYQLLIIFTLFYYLFTPLTYSFSGPGDEVIYDAAVNSVGFVSDKSGAIASGFFINENTFITNYHVSKELDVESANIEMKDGTSFSVKKIIKEYGTVDLAIISTEERSSNTLRLEDENKPEKNDEVYSIGNPTDNKQHVDYYKVTKGRIKNILEDDWFYDKQGEDKHKALVIQHTAIIKPGNSGGPLLNKYGRVIGINTFFYDDSLNYAVHIDELIKILNKNGIGFNETVKKSDTKKTTQERSFKKRVEYVFDRHVYYYHKFYLLIISGILLYYMAVVFGAITIITFIAVKGNSRKIRKMSR